MSSTQVAPREAFSDRVNAVWSQNPEQRDQVEGWYWMRHPMVAARVNTLISGAPDCDAYGRLQRLYRERGWALPIGRAVSLGCGFGNLERALKAIGLVDRIDAYDLAEAAIAEARRLATEAGLSGITYHVADLDALELPPGALDAVFAHSAVHHVEKLERLYAMVQRALRPGGVFHLHEYVGPTRFQWTDAQLRLVNDYLDSLPPRLRRLPSGQPKARMERPTVAAMIQADPSEAVRSAELVSALHPYFEIVEERRTGGALLHLALGDIAQNFDPANPEDCAALRRGFATEDRAMAAGEIGSDFAIITAVPRPLPAAMPVMSNPIQRSVTMPSLTTRTARLFPAGRKLSDAIRAASGAIEHLSAEQRRQAGINAAMQAEQARLSAALAALSAPTAHAAPPVPAPAAAAPAAAEDQLDRWAAREMQSAAVRNLPFLPGHIALDEDGIRMEGYAGAPEGLSANMAFFINGRRFDRVDFPIRDAALAASFPEVRGVGAVVRATMTQHLDELRADRFWRLDAAPNGHYVPQLWRQAIHFMNPLFEQFPMPPEPNIKRVIGDTSQVRFAMGGAILIRNVEAYLGELGQSWSDFPRILDWGCGAGRLTRYLLSETQADVTGADIDADNIGWCRQAYPRGHFETVPLRPPTTFADASFDLVTGLSVMTHLAEPDQFAWLAELERITRPGGLVFLSVQGPTQFAYNNFPPKLYRQLQEVGYLDLCRDPALDGVVSDTEYYRSAMHSRGYIVDRWSRHFEVLAIVDAIAALQDFVVMRRR
jgi:2-polyprenyl-3-methyl-5-hydroxy-6-metoxy-1,4-benzoquinol methylase